MSKINVSFVLDFLLYILTVLNFCITGILFGLVVCLSGGLGGTTGSASDSRSEGRGFDSR